jgi:hypothetical protein
MTEQSIFRYQHRAQLNSEARQIFRKFGKRVIQRQIDCILISCSSAEEAGGEFEGFVMTLTRTIKGQTKAIKKHVSHQFNNVNERLNSIQLSLNNLKDGAK